MNITNMFFMIKEDTVEQFFDMQNDGEKCEIWQMENAYRKELQKHRNILEKWMKTYNIRSSRSKLHDVPGKKMASHK